MNSAQNIAITGMGILSSIGSTSEQMAESLKQSKCGITRNMLHRCGKTFTLPIGQVDDLDGICGRLFDLRRARRWDALTRMSLAATVMALQDAQVMNSTLEWKNTDPKRVGLVLGNGWGGIDTTEDFFCKAVEQGPQAANPSLFPETVPNAASGHVCIELGIKGPYTTITQKQITFEASLGLAISMLRRGDLDLMITGALEDIGEWCYFGHAHSGCLVKDKKSPELRPFDQKRSGTLLGEGGAVFVLELEDSARRRGAQTYAQIEGLALGGVSAGPSNWPRGAKAQKHLQMIARNLFQENGISPEQIDWVSASALGSQSMDSLEANLLYDLFGATAPISALSGATGSFACLGSLRLAAAILAMREGIIPATLGLESPEGPPLHHVYKQALCQPSQRVFLNTIADGGGYAGILLTG